MDARALAAGEGAVEHGQDGENRRLVRSPEEVTRVALLYDILRGEALPRGASTEMIMEVMGTWT